MILVTGIKQSSRFNIAMVIIKLLVLGFFVALGSFYVKPQNWVPFAPNGFAGIKAGAAIAFFAYIGFDCVSTVAEETRNPKRDMPIGIKRALVSVSDKTGIVEFCRELSGMGVSVSLSSPASFGKIVVPDPGMFLMFFDHPLEDCGIGGIKLFQADHLPVAAERYYPCEENSS